ncbi:MAG: hypothetical protein ACE5OZ_14245 [Candidatus Heimdallarchaeota archaeon]
MVDSEIIPISSNQLLLFLGILLLALIVYFRQKYSWNNSEFLGLGFILVLLIGAMLLVPMKVHTTCIPDEPIDVTIMIDARIKPWAFNITAIYDENGTEIPIDDDKYERMDGGVGFSPSNVYNTIELEVGLLYNLTVTALDTDHGLEIKGLENFCGHPIKESLPALKSVSVYVKPTTPGEYTYFCDFFCGQGHGDMRSKVKVV